MSTNISEINRIVRHNPTELKYLFKSPTEDKRRLTRLISHLVPYRVGIEFETFGAVGEYLYPELVKEQGLLRKFSATNKRHKISVNQLICKRLGLVDFSEDFHRFSYSKTSESKLNEVRVSISGYRQLITLWDTLQVLKKCLIIPEKNGGIHIHIDAPFVNSNNRSEIVKYLDNSIIQSEVLRIFEGYDGTYNKRGCDTSKGKYLRVSLFPSIEFRIARLTYDYSTIMRYIIKCSELVRRCKFDYMNGNGFIVKEDSKSQLVTEDPPPTNALQGVINRMDNRLSTLYHSYNDDSIDNTYWTAQFGA